MISRSYRLLIPLFLTFSAASLPSQAQKLGQVTVGGVSVAGLDPSAAARRLNRVLAPKLNQRIALTAGSKALYRTRRQLGFSLDVGASLARAKQQPRAAVAFAVDQKALSTALSRINHGLSGGSQSPRPVLVGKKVQIRGAQPRLVIDASQSAARIKAQVEKDASKTRFALVTATARPAAAAAKLQGINAVLSSFTTRFNPGKKKRTLNMRLATRSIDGTVLAPGATFSLNSTVGERTQARGYRTAIIFEGGKEEPGLGGGVSQVTGTLFNAALVAGLPIETYRVHTRPVAYLPLGRDATVSWGNFDMKFKNNTQSPIFIAYKLSGSRLTATLFGHKTGRRGSMRVVSHRNGARDISAQLYRTIRQGGKVVKKEKVGSSHYNWKADDGD